MKIAVLASGGVDSSVALKLLQNQGHDVTAFYLKIWLKDELSFLGDCPWEEDLSYLRTICEQNKIPLEVINLQKEYHQEVVSYSLEEIRAGRTPNSDLLCNSKIKFGKFFERIGDEFQAIASGHYADKLVLSAAGEPLDQLSPAALAADTHHFLKTAKDTFKDQTYFLAHLNENQLRRAIFPLGPYLKSEVRALAHDFNLPNQARKDSQGICFLGQIKYNQFVRFHLGEKPGDLINIDTQKVIGHHKGYWFYTIGQRKGIELSGGPWFVVKKDIERNLVYISNHYHDTKVSRDHFEITNLHWLSTPPSPEQLANLHVKVRHGENSYPATITHPTTGVEASSKNHQVQIQGSDQGFAAGQFAVFYSGEVCLGCATIC